MLLSLYRRLYLPLNGAATVLLLGAGLVVGVASGEAARAVPPICGAMVVLVLATLLRRRPASGPALAVGIVAMLAAAALLGAPGVEPVRGLLLVVCGCQGVLVVLCTLLRADGQDPVRDSVVE